MIFIPIIYPILYSSTQTSTTLALRYCHPLLSITYYSSDNNIIILMRQLINILQELSANRYVGRLDSESVLFVCISNVHSIFYFSITV